MNSIDLSPAEVRISDDVGDTQSILLTVTDDGVAVDLTAWTITGQILDARGGTVVGTYTVSAGATRTLTFSAAASATLGEGSRWYVIRATDPSGHPQTLAHGRHDLGVG